MSLFDIARHANQQIQISIRYGDPFLWLNFLDKVGPKSVESSKHYLALLDRKGLGNVAVSNLGIFDFPERIGDIEIESPQFFSALSVYGYFFTAINTTHDHLYCNFSYIDKLISDQHANALAKRIWFHLLNCIND